MSKTVMSADNGGAPFDVVAIVASAGGHAAVPSILQNLPKDFAVPVIVMFHLGLGSDSVAMYRRLAPFHFDWVEAHSTLRPGQVLICPPHSHVEVLPDATVKLRDCESVAGEKPMDRFLESIGRSFGRRAIGVVLTGMGADGSKGSTYLKREGGLVIVQNEKTSEFPDMPRAAVENGAASLVLPITEIGKVIGELAKGTEPAKVTPELDAIRRVFGEVGETARLAADLDWSQTALGPVMTWPETLRLMVRTTLANSYPMAVWWGTDLIQIYNDAWTEFLGREKHPGALGGAAADSWPEIWNLIGPMLDKVMTSGEACGKTNFPMFLHRNDILEEVFATFSYSPIRDPGTGAILGAHNTVIDTSYSVLGERRMRLLQVLAADLADSTTPDDVFERATRSIATDPADIPFVLIYQFDEGRRQATLSAAVGVEEGSAAAPPILHVDAEETPWPVGRLTAELPLCGIELDNLGARLSMEIKAIASPIGATVDRALLLPLTGSAGQAQTGVVVFGLSPHRPFDQEYRDFLKLVEVQLSGALASATAKQLARERRENLAELDRAKTEFFANVSHEFRTPLTLLLAPLEELQHANADLPSGLRAEIDASVRNGRRLLNLVNSLLDFSSSEGRRGAAAFEATDLKQLTMDVASAFRSAMESAGIEFRIKCDELPQRAHVDREMWEKIVSNLLSNALKFTFKGSVSIELSALKLHAELVVSDTGVGIPANELSNIFKRFHRVRDTKARTIEGSGIGLSLVSDMVERMGGQISVRSTPGVGTAFTVWVPYKSARIRADLPLGAAGIGEAAFARQMAQQASRWLEDGTSTKANGSVREEVFDTHHAGNGTKEARLLVVDDNADLRSYLHRLLSPRWDVTLAANATDALKEAFVSRPDLIITDVMMPGMDGFEFMREIRQHPDLNHTPIVLLTARTGESDAIEGLLAGADDYIAKPFSARELVVRIGAVIDRARAEKVLRESEERMQQMLNVPGVSVLTFNPQTGVLIDANPAFLEVSGYTREQVDAGELTWRKMTPDEWHDVSLAQMKQFEHTGKIGPYEKEYLVADGTRRRMVLAGARMSDGNVVEYCLDVTTCSRAVGEAG